MKKIYVNGGYLSHSVTGIQRYARELMGQFDEMLSAGEIEGWEIVLLFPRNARDIPAYRSIRIQQVGILTGQSWAQIELPLYCRDRLLFSPGGGAPLLHRGNAVTIHDAAVKATPSAYSYLYRSWFSYLYGFWSRHAFKVFTVSQFSKQELIRFFQASEERIVVTYLSGDHMRSVDSDGSVLERHRLVPKRFILAVASANPNKNVGMLGQVAKELTDLNLPFVIAGGSNPTSFAEEGPLADSLTRIGYVNDQELRTLYENAACFVFPSLYEGFGIPPLEALGLGTPVVVANSASLSEVFAGGALLADPHDPRDFAQKIKQAVHGAGPSYDHRLHFAAQFSWKKCARETWKVLEDLCQQ